MKGSIINWFYILEFFFSYLTIDYGWTTKMYPKYSKWIRTGVLLNENLASPDLHVIFVSEGPPIVVWPSRNTPSFVFIVYKISSHNLWVLGLGLGLGFFWKLRDRILKTMPHFSLFYYIVIYIIFNIGLVFKIFVWSTFVLIDFFLNQNTFKN